MLLEQLDTQEQMDPENEGDHLKYKRRALRARVNAQLKKFEALYQEATNAGDTSWMRGGEYIPVSATTQRGYIKPNSPFRKQLQRISDRIDISDEQSEIIIRKIRQLENRTGKKLDVN